MKLGIDPTVDIVFKRIFGSEDNALVLIDLLHAVIQPAQAITGLAISQAHSDREWLDDKQAIGDVRARDQGNRQFHVEMQTHVPWFFPQRVLYYWSKFHPQQLRVGEDYQTLRPTISICFLNQTCFPEETDHHLIFRLLETKKGLLLSDNLEIHLIELPKFTKTAEQLSSGLDRWCFFLRHGAELDPEHLPPGLDVPMIRRAVEVLKVFTQDEREREVYEQRLKFQRDLSSSLRDQREQGIEVGRKEGTLTGQIRLCQELLKQPLTSEAELISRSREDLAALLAQLRKQLLSNGA